MVCWEAPEAKGPWQDGMVALQCVFAPEVEHWADCERGRCCAAAGEVGLRALEDAGSAEGSGVAQPARPPGREPSVALPRRWARCVLPAAGSESCCVAR